MITSSKKVELSEDIFGGLPGIVPEADLNGTVAADMEQPASAEYFIENKVMGVPVAEEDQQLALRESDNIQSLFEPVGSVHTLCFLLKPGELSEDLAEYDQVQTAVRNGTASVISEDHTYDPAMKGYVIMLTYSLDSMALRKEFKGHFMKLKDLTPASSNT